MITAMLQPLLTALDQAVTVVDGEGRVLEWNDAAERMYNLSRSAILGQKITGFFAPASLMVQRVLETAKPVEPTYHQAQPGVHVMVTALPVLADDGRLVGAVAIERDVSHIADLSARLVTAADRVATLERQLAAQAGAQPGRGNPFQAIRGRHPAIQQAVSLARRIAPTQATTLILGESGVGKELFARGIHLASKRRHGAFVALNCGAIPTALFESELFGYAPGAFTSANPKGQAGKLELANHGTLFLDEVAELPWESQAKLLRVLEDGQFYRVGGTTPVAVDVRIIAATNRPLEELVQQHHFRSDLYWRLNVVTLELPPLRERKEDIAGLVTEYVHEFNLRHERSVTKVDPAVIAVFMRYGWPGNVRELRNVVERMVVLAEGSQIGPALLPAPFRRLLAAEEAEGAGLREAAAGKEREEILAALAATGHNRTAAAKLLGISRGTLYNKSRKAGIPLEPEPA